MKNFSLFRYFYKYPTLTGPLALSASRELLWLWTFELIARLRGFRAKAVQHVEKAGSIGTDGPLGKNLFRFQSGYLFGQGCVDELIQANPVPSGGTTGCRQDAFGRLQRIITLTHL
jgi:hypothetical protein